VLKTIIYIALGGAIGSVLRYLTSFVVAKFWNGHFPLATFLTNGIGCFLMGVFMGYLHKNQIADSHLKWFLITGFCGGYTTFSAFGFENISLFQQQNSFLAFTYIVLSIIGGLFAVWLGLFVTK
jgi:fluoride exporter